MPEEVLETLSEAPTSAPQSFGADSDRLAADMIERFFAATDGFHASLDVAALNLCCAQGLPGAKNLNIDKHLAKIDEIARHVRLETELHYYRFLENPDEFEAIRDGPQMAPRLYLMRQVRTICLTFGP